MREATTCNIGDAPLRAERYVTEQMPETERIAFEDHFIVCGECQREIQLANAVRAALAASARSGGGAGERASTRSNRRSLRWLGAGVALAAGIGAIALVREAPSPALAALGRVREPPAYLGAAVRGEPGHADSIFDGAMSSFTARRYAEAVVGLRAALAAGQDSVPTEFFLGASLLLSNDERGAVAAFDRVVAKGDTPYRAEAQLYEAKALLRLGRGREALEVLTRHTPADPVFSKILSALSDSVAQIVGR